jgi:hypothetical protein
MFWIEKFCKELPKEDQPLCRQLGSDFRDLLSDLKKKGYLRSELTKKGEEGKVNSEHVIENLRKMTDAFNKFNEMYVDKERRKKFIELNEPYGMTKTDLDYLLYSTSVSVFLVNIEVFRAFLLFIMELPIQYEVKGKPKYINSKATLRPLLECLEKLEIEKADALSDIDYKLRNGLSHGLFWLHERGDPEHSKPHLHYSTDIAFKNIKWISFDDLLSKTKNQAIYTICLLYVIVDFPFSLSHVHHT